MTGGVVIQTCVLPDKVWLLCAEVPRGRKPAEGPAQTTGVYVQPTAKARTVSEGDVIWWQGPSVLWTPMCQLGNKPGVQGRTFDIELERIGLTYSKIPLEVSEALGLKTTVKQCSQT